MKGEFEEQQKMDFEQRDGTKNRMYKMIYKQYSITFKCYQVYLVFRGYCDLHRIVIIVNFAHIIYNIKKGSTYFER